MIIVLQYTIWREGISNKKCLLAMIATHQSTQKDVCVAQKCLTFCVANDIVVPVLNKGA